jgi:hypothetical protein
MHVHAINPGPVTGKNVNFVKWLAEFDHGEAALLLMGPASKMKGLARGGNYT